MRFRDRAAAGRDDVVVLGPPRGGAPVAYPVAEVVDALLMTPRLFRNVDTWHHDFSRITNREVLTLLKEAQRYDRS
jgi:predicted phosphoribosyltransferase